MLLGMGIRYVRPGDSGQGIVCVSDWMDVSDRLAIDLNMHRPTNLPSDLADETRAREREIHNRQRTWIVCFNLDRSFSAQMGKPYTIKEE